MKELQNRIEELNPWHYEFDFNGVKTPIRVPQWKNRHIQRRKYFLDPLVEFYGGSLKGKKVLDIGCNSGYWSFECLDAECDYVIGIDPRKLHIEQANLVAETKGIGRDRCRFVQESIFTYWRSSDIKPVADIVLCLGLFYHTCKQIEMMEEIEIHSPEILVIDTMLSDREGSVLELRRDSIDEPTAAYDYELVYYPTAEAAVEIVGQFGYDVIMLYPDFDDFTGCDDYKNGDRRAFVCSKNLDLLKFPAVLEDIL